MKKEENKILLITGENEMVETSIKFKEQTKILLKDYAELKKEIVTAGFDEKVFKFVDYMKFFLEWNKK